MTRRPTQMTTDEYDAYVAVYGRDIALWPVRERIRAEVFLETGEGKSAVLLDKAFASVTDEAASFGEHGADDFIARLQVIPKQYQQAVPSDVSAKIVSTGFFQQIEKRLDRWLDPARILSPKGLVSHAAAVAAVLGLGVVAGSQQTMVDTFSDYDISADLFEADSQEYVIDG